MQDTQPVGVLVECCKTLDQVSLRSERPQPSLHGAEGRDSRRRVTDAKLERGLAPPRARSLFCCSHSGVQQQHVFTTVVQD